MTVYPPYPSQGMQRAVYLSWCDTHVCMYLMYSAYVSATLSSGNPAMGLVGINSPEWDRVAVCACDPPAVIIMHAYVLVQVISLFASYVPGWLLRPYRY